MKNLVDGFRTCIQMDLRDFEDILSQILEHEFVCEFDMGNLYIENIDGDDISEKVLEKLQKYWDIDILSIYVIENGNYPDILIIYLDKN